MKVGAPKGAFKKVHMTERIGRGQGLTVEVVTAGIEELKLPTVQRVLHLEAENKCALFKLGAKSRDTKFCESFHPHEYDRCCNGCA
jgi:hypothetical protein